jgi:phosphopantothenoylcysteine synthetase/decarboxylase
VHAGAVPAAASPAKKKNKFKTLKYKTKRNKKILKGRHGKRERKPA